jgi:hypothetical protein
MGECRSIWKRLTSDEKIVVSALMKFVSHIVKMKEACVAYIA